MNVNILPLLIAMAFALDGAAETVSADSLPANLPEEVRLKVENRRKALDGFSLITNRESTPDEQQQGYELTLEAAAAEDAVAANNLGYLSATGAYGLAQKNPQKALYWYERALEKGYPAAAVNILQLNEETPGLNPGFDLLADANLLLAKAYAHGTEVIPYNFEKSQQFYLQAARMGSEEAAGVIRELLEQFPDALGPLSEADRRLIWPQAAELQKADSGEVERLEMLSPEMQQWMTIDVWLPEGYNPVDTSVRYPVVYMHDGQNLYDATTTWNHQAWEVDSVAGRLIAEGLIQAPIVVGIHSDNATRVADLMPRRAMMEAGLSDDLARDLFGGAPMRGDDYLAFIAERLKPYIDHRYNTRPEASQTSLMGSSMGGLMSVYGMAEYPDLFGNAICLSTHWSGRGAEDKEFGQAMAKYLRRYLPASDTHRLYLDHGTETIDANYGPWEEIMIGIAKEKGYSEPTSLMTYVDQGAAHDEKSWAARLQIPLMFLLGKEKK